MKRYILTGAPGSGKTVLLRQLELEGYGVVEEAATDVIALWQARGIAQPWEDPSFLDAVTSLQTQRQLRAATAPDQVQFHDRSAFCTVALARYLEMPVPPILSRELDRLQSEAIFETKVLFIQNLGFVTPTEARRIGFEESLRFERLHKEVYQDHGFELVCIPSGQVPDRIAAIRAAIAT